jgi:hypothetical protein
LKKTSPAPPRTGKPSAASPTCSPKSCIADEHGLACPLGNRRARGVKLTYAAERHHRDPGSVLSRYGFILGRGVRVVLFPGGVSLRMPITSEGRYSCAPAHDARLHEQRLRRALRRRAPSTERGQLRAIRGAMRQRMRIFSLTHYQAFI